MADGRGADKFTELTVGGDQTGRVVYLVVTGRIKLLLRRRHEIRHSGLVFVDGKVHTL